LLLDPGEFYQLFHGRRLGIARQLLSTDRAVALDVGCGSGLLNSLGLTGAIGIDIRMNSAVTVRASAESLPFRDRVFDLVFAGEVLEHLHLPAEALDEWVRVLCAGGRLILSTPNGRLVQLEGNHPEHKHVFTSRDLKKALARRGIDHVVVRSIFVGFVSGRRLFRFMPLKVFKIFLLRLPVPAAVSYDLFLTGTRRP
jgi:SAM-dependent methyltransferase